MDPTREQPKIKSQPISSVYIWNFIGYNINYTYITEKSFLSF